MDVTAQFNELPMILSHNSEKNMKTASQKKQNKQNQPTMVSRAFWYFENKPDWSPKQIADQLWKENFGKTKESINNVIHQYKALYKKRTKNAHKNTPVEVLVNGLPGNVEIIPADGENNNFLDFSVVQLRVTDLLSQINNLENGLVTFKSALKIVKQFKNISEIDAFLSLVKG